MNAARHEAILDICFDVLPDVHVGQCNHDTQQCNPYYLLTFYASGRFRQQDWKPQH